MRFNKKSICELRKEIEELLATVPEGKRITLDTDLLEELIFFKICHTNEKGNYFEIKIPVWTGEFLRKLDLSKLSFENVYFSTGLLVIDNPESQSRFYRTQCLIPNFCFNLKRYHNVLKKEEILEEHKKHERNDFGGEKEVTITEKKYHYFAPFVRAGDIDFSGTNIKIDFSKIFGTTIQNTKFDGVDLSRSNAHILTNISGCSFRNTNVELNYDNPKLKLENSDFSNNDFSYVNIGVDSFYRDTNNFETSYITNCNFSNTELQITYRLSFGDKRKMLAEFGRKYEEKNRQSYYRSAKLFERQEMDREASHFLKKVTDIVMNTPDRLGIELKKGNFTGCYVNGKKISSHEERQNVKRRLRSKYQEYFDGKRKAIIENIQQQISDM